MTHDELAFSEVISSVWRPCLFSAIGNRCSNETKSIHCIYTTKFQRSFGATFAALARGFSDRHFERGEGPGDEVETRDSVQKVWKLVTSPTESTWTQNQLRTASDVTVIWVSPCFGYSHTQIPSEMGIPSKYGCRVFGIPGYPTPSQMRVEFGEHLLKSILSSNLLPLVPTQENEPMCLALLCIKSFPCVIRVQTDLTLSG